MVPDAYGTNASLSDRVPFTISETVDLDGTNVEEWDDLGVAVFVQDMGTKDIYQSGYGVEGAVFATDATLTSITYDGEPVPGFSPDVFEYTVTLPFGTVEIPMVEAVSADPDATTIIVPAHELPGSTTIDVFAEDLATHNTYTVNFDISTGFDNPDAIKAISVFPKPYNREGIC